ncbi:RnfABCDGE type electron transport complex subunit D [Cohaesibacter sp. CAU 1516]|uniref:RnfABCDGE type electron transport complex subunit D n=1 Tax=Cohaesibacter sp. CAU 1516 TaxID=2576038 RepID=UPI0010FF1492|nr:RnfABCDGE type electron transport complex subunit D [Cohaesibacter sp. CAU 1516]TLP44271.1 RnfABCDGE type electron transport complex subunit D [Cohaesibacter sp. CAU 1516]
MTDVTSGPFLHSGASVSRTMGLVILALVPSTAFGLYLYGWPAITLFVVTISSALLFEAIALKLAGKPILPFLTDGSGLLTGWLLAMTLPPWAPWWIGLIGSMIAILLAKHAFGGLGQNIFNPAMIARTVLLISFPVQMTQFLPPLPLSSANAPGFREGIGVVLTGHAGLDALSGASLLGSIKTQLGQGETLPSILASLFDMRDAAIGSIAGSMGETSALLALLGGLFLLITRVISWHIPVSMIAAMVALSTLCHSLNPDLYLGPDVHLLSGAFLFSAFFIATDYVTAPGTDRGKIIFGAGIGMLTFVIRTWAAYPEGVAFAVLLMNATAPLIDAYVRPRIYGRTRKGTPLSYPDDHTKGPTS